MLEPANYYGRKKLTKVASKKYYLSDGTGLPVQTINKGANNIWKMHKGQFMRNRRSVWTVPTRRFKGAHFATFPPDLIRTCIAAGCPVGGVVFDPFMGTRTTAIVAQELGRNYIGIELNEEYIKIAEERWKKCKSVCFILGIIYAATIYYCSVTLRNESVTLLKVILPLSQSERTSNPATLQNPGYID